MQEGRTTEKGFVTSSSLLQASFPRHLWEAGTSFRECPGSQPCLSQEAAGSSEGSLSVKATRGKDFVDTVRNCLNLSCSKPEGFVWYSRNPKPRLEKGALLIALEKKLNLRLSEPIECMHELGLGSHLFITAAPRPCLGLAFMSISEFNQPLVSIAVLALA